jgi:hypothetical protein
MPSPQPPGHFYPSRFDDCELLRTIDDTIAALEDSDNGIISPDLTASTGDDESDEPFAMRCRGTGMVDDDNSTEDELSFKKEAKLIAVLPNSAHLRFQEKEQPKKTVKNIRMSLEKQRRYLKVARMLHSLSKNKSKYTDPPSTFSVPPKAPWPKDLLGSVIQFSHLRKSYAQGHVYPEIAEGFNSINFVWDKKEHKKKLQLEALRIYKHLRGNLSIPLGFIIPRKQHEWPRELWGMNLYDAVNHIRIQVTQGLINEGEQRQLHEIGFPF